MVIVVFRFHAKPEANLEELGGLAARMAGLVSETPGFVSVKDFSSQDGESVVVAEFESLEAVDAWKAHPEHVAAQRRGREEFFSDYRVQVCSLIRTTESAVKT